MGVFNQWEISTTPDMNFPNENRGLVSRCVL